MDRPDVKIVRLSEPAHSGLKGFAEELSTAEGNGRRVSMSAALEVLLEYRKEAFMQHWCRKTYREALEE